MAAEIRGSVDTRGTDARHDANGASGSPAQERFRRNSPATTPETGLNRNSDHCIGVRAGTATPSRSRFQTTRSAATRRPGKRLASRPERIAQICDAIISGSTVYPPDQLSRQTCASKRNRICSLQRLSTGVVLCTRKSSRRPLATQRHLVAPRRRRSTLTRLTVADNGVGVFNESRVGVYDEA